MHINNDSVPDDMTETKLNDLLKKKPRPLRIGMQQQVNISGQQHIHSSHTPSYNGYICTELTSSTTYNQL